jgi:hypothetical protein
MTDKNFARLAAVLTQRTLFRRFKPGDWVVLEDEALMGALNGTEPLMEDELRAVLDSPLTLRRARVLFEHMVAQRNRRDTAANDDDFWQGSVGYLRAAESDVKAETLRSENKVWSLGFLAEREGWRVVLKADLLDHPRVLALIDAGVELRVTSANGAEVLRGTLDESGELEGGWLFDADPYPWFMAQGGSFKVQEA